MKINEIITRGELSQVRSDLGGVARTVAPDLTNKIKTKAKKFAQSTSTKDTLGALGTIVRSPLTAYQGLSRGFDAGAAAAAKHMKGSAKEPVEPAQKKDNKPQLQNQPELMNYYIDRVDNLNPVEASQALQLITKAQADGNTLPSNINQINAKLIARIQKK